jgi:1,2-diacylglycerol 3-alpha-glucosyltransferase
LKIAIVSNSRSDSNGGSARVAQEMARYFASVHEVMLICPGDRAVSRQETDNLTRFEVLGAGKGDVCVPSLTPGSQRRLSAALEAFGPDVIHSHDPLSINQVVQAWANERGVPFVHTAHLDPSRYLDFGISDVTRLFKFYAIERTVTHLLEEFYRNCDAVVAPNKAADSELRHFGYMGSIFVIPNGRTLGEYRSCKNSNIGAKEKVLTFIGWISGRKNQLFLVQATKYLPDNYRLQIVGTWLDPSYRRTVERAMQEQSYANIRFLGQIDYAEIPARLEETHVFVSASKMEVQSLAVIEALASGTPVVGLSNETIDELVDDTVGFRLPKDASPQDFADRVRAICELTQSDYDGLCERARLRVQSHDWSVVMTQTIAAYQQVALVTSPRAVSRTTRMHLALTAMSSSLAFPLVGPTSRYLQARGSRATSR